MTVYHRNLTTGSWGRLSVCEQMAHIGSEVSRALNWSKKGNGPMSMKAVERALELVDLSLDSLRSFSRLKEFARMREALVDYFYGANSFSSSDRLWRKYFDHFNYVARKNR